MSVRELIKQLLDYPLDFDIVVVTEGMVHIIPESPLLSDGDNNRVEIFLEE